MHSTINKGKSQKQKGGSPASDLVNEALINAPFVKHDFVTSPRIREGKMDGGSTASNMVMSNLKHTNVFKPFPSGFKVDGDINSLSTYKPSGGARHKSHKSHKSGKAIRSRKSRKSRKSHKARKSRKSSKSHKSSKSGKSRKSRKSRKMTGGGSDWMSSQYSLGPYNQAEMSAVDLAKFSHSASGTRTDYMNPPNLGLAGSGYQMTELEGANVKTIGAPLI